MEAFRGSGPGGQKRNKTSSAIRATHEPTGLWAISDDTRSQIKNRETAKWRLRHELTIRCRRDPALPHPEGFPQNWLDLSQKNPSYFTILGHVLDVLHAANYSISQAAAHLSTTTAQLAGFLTRDELAHAEINRMRLSRGLKPLGRR